MPGHSASEDARERAYDPGIHRKEKEKFLRSGWIGPRVKLGEVKPGNDDIASVAVPDQRGIASLALALRRIRDTLS
jgi:hypothetical protein